jgi:hypothetical protein
MVKFWRSMWDVLRISPKEKEGDLGTSSIKLFAAWKSRVMF